MSSTSTAERGGLDAHATSLPAFVDWVVAALLAVVGLGFALGGAAMALTTDRAGIERAVAEGEIRSDVLAGPDLVEVTLSVATWFGVGLLAIGVVLVGGAIAFAVARRRTYRRAAAGEPTSDFVAIALVGALVSSVLSFIPLSPAIGGGVAGYLERGESERSVSAGALSGLLVFAPLAAMAAFALLGLAVGLSGIGEGTWAIVIGIGLLFVLAVTAVVGGGLGALGGYVGGRIAEEQAE